WKATSAARRSAEAAEQSTLQAVAALEHERRASTAEVVLATLTAMEQWLQSDDARRDRAVVYEWYKRNPNARPLDRSSKYWEAAERVAARFQSAGHLTKHLGDAPRS